MVKVVAFIHQISSGIDHGPMVAHHVRYGDFDTLRLRQCVGLHHSRELTQGPQVDISHRVDFQAGTSQVGAKTMRKCTMSKALTCKQSIAVIQIVYTYVGWAKSNSSFVPVYKYHDLSG
jgi:hypothetical protein